MTIKKRVTLTVEVDLDAYALEYGDPVDTAQEQAAALDYAQELVLEAAHAQLSPHSWAKIATRRAIIQ